MQHRSVSGFEPWRVHCGTYRDPEKRPSAREALLHPWLAVGGDEDRRKGKPLASTVVQRIQRFQQGNLVQRSIFEMIAQELLNMLPPPPPTPGDSTNHSQQHCWALPQPAQLTQ